MENGDYDKLDDLNASGDTNQSTENVVQNNDEEDYIIKTGTQISCLEQALLSYNDPQVEEAVAQFKKYNIRFKNLASLEDTDLELLGIQNEETRRQMLDDFANFPNQQTSFNEIIANTNPKEYNEIVMKNITVHLENLHTALLIARVKMDIKPPEDVYLDDENIYASDLVLKVIERMTAECDRMQDLLNNIYSSCTVEDRSPGSLKRVAKICLYTGLAITGGWLAVKYLKPQKLWNKFSS